ncbi:MAG: DUF1294 domain-containing protein [Peptococcaceae bacterium]|nr:DUF1294 domain-containing protein [Peptococcaceae bacterium]
MYPFIYLLVINLAGFFTIGLDKSKARKDRWRIPERRFFILAFFGGSLGVYLGMHLFRHKTQHVKFTVGIPLMIILNIFCGYFILRYWF